MSNQRNKDWFRQALQVADQVKKTVGDASSQAGEIIGNTTSQVKQTASELTDQVGQVVSDQVSQVVSRDSPNLKKATNQNFIDMCQVDEETRLAFYGALFAVALADNSIDKEEVELIFSMMELDGMTETARRQVQSYIIEPPSLWKCLSSLGTADEQLRYGLMINLVDTAWANDELDADEEKAISMAQHELKISDEQLEAIEKFIQKMREIRVRGIDDNYAADAIKVAASGLSAVGIPIAAVWFSGSVIGLSAAGITSGLAGLGALIGIGGMVPGIGVAILVGAGIFMGVNALLDTGDKSKKAQFQAEKERKAQLVIKNMQGSINQLVDQISELQEKAISLEANASDAEANREAIRLLTERLKFMRQSIAKRKQVFGVS
jgi:uncharacterized tellurite resistance protein B-like protein